MSNFDYVTNKRMREVLLSANANKNDLAWALEYSTRCFRADDNNTDIPSDILNVRGEALDNAFDCFLDQKYRSTAKSLRLFWSV